MFSPFKMLGWFVPGWVAPLAVAAVLVSGVGWYKWQIHKSYSAGREAERTAARIEAGKRIVEMEKSNALFKNMAARDRCIAFMRDSGLPEHHCNER